MKAAVLRQAPGRLEIEDVEIDSPATGEVLVRTAAAGVCHSDQHVLEGQVNFFPTPMVLGHESAGVVEAVGEGVTYVEPGDHVVTCLSVFCGHCDFCLTGRAFSCMTDESALARGEGRPRLTSGGETMNQFVNLSSFAEQLLINQNALVKIREDMPLEKAALLGCGVTTGMGAAINSAQVTPGSKVVVIGVGGVGLAALQGARISGAAQIVAVDMHGHKLELAKRLGATDVVDASKDEPVQAVLDLTGGGVDFGFEAIGLPETTRQMFSMTRSGGLATVVGILPVGAEIPMTGADFMGSKRYQSSMMGGGSFRVEVPRYIDFYLNGQLRLDEMVSQTLPLERINDAFDSMTRGEVARSVIVFDS
ncbi:Zn-dependent alcohol dehydrogenase [Myxococcota bacterium]|nr:Zn-dependent alcohol dehydrogenase [Myxococcota bacterium]